MAKERSRKRRYKVPRGTGAAVAKQMGLARSSVTRVISGDRPGGAKLTKRLEEIERNALGLATKKSWL